MSMTNGESERTGEEPGFNSLLFGGAKAFPFDEIGASVEGEVLSATTVQQRSMEGELLFWPDGRKRWQGVITLQTALRDDDNDDGIRTIYAKGGHHDIAKGEGQSMMEALKSAVRAVKATGIHPGATLVVAYTGDAPAKRGYNPAKLYTAGYRPPKADGISAKALFADERQTESDDPF